MVTDRGEIETDVVVNAGGIYAREIGAMAGVNVPIIPMAHEYLITKPAGIPVDLPTMRDPSLLVYFRPDAGGLIQGWNNQRAVHRVPYRRVLACGSMVLLIVRTYAVPHANVF